jgi:hypothetical protein
MDELLRTSLAQPALPSLRSLFSDRLLVAEIAMNPLPAGQRSQRALFAGVGEGAIPVGRWWLLAKRGNAFQQRR